MKSKNPFSKNNEPKDKGKHRTNYDIRVPEVRLIDVDNSILGIKSRTEALKIAESKNLDLVEIAPKAIPPVCKIVDYGKFLYELQKKEKSQKKTQTQQMLKEIRFKSRTASHDFNFKVKHARSFIEEGNKVKASVLFRGREMAHTEIGRELLEKFIEAMSDIAKVDQPLNAEGRNIAVILSPLKTKKTVSKAAKPSEQKEFTIEEIIKK